MRSPYALLIIVAVIFSSQSNTAVAEEKLRSGRQKRVLWVTNDGRLALPPGSTMVLTPSFSMPFIRHPLEGFLSNISVSLPFTVDFDKLGLTDNENPYGDPFWYASEEVGRATGSVVADLLGKYLRGKRSPRQEPSIETSSEIQKRLNTIFHGGER